MSKPIPGDDDPASWRVLATRYLHRRPWLTLREDHVRLPTGAEIEAYWVMEFPAWVNVVAVTDDQHVVLVRQYRHGVGRVDYELPAGVVAEGEDPLAAARRELVEETGYAGGTWTALMTVSANPALQDNLTYCFIAEGVRATTSPCPDSTEDLRVHLVPREQVLGLIDGGAVLQSLHVAPLLRFLAGKTS